MTFICFVVGFMWSLRLYYPKIFLSEDTHKMTEKSEKYCRFPFCTKLDLCEWVNGQLSAEEPMSTTSSPGSVMEPIYRVIQLSCRILLSFFSEMKKKIFEMQCLKELINCGVPLSCNWRLMHNSLVKFWMFRRFLHRHSILTASDEMKL